MIMEMPALLTTDLEVYRDSKTDEELLQRLTSHPENLLSFFKVAADDETWSLKHPLVMQEILKSLTNKSFENRLEMENIKQIQTKIQDHISILDSYLPLDLIVEVEATEVHVNSLLFSAASFFMQNLIRHECFEVKSNKLMLADVSLDTFKLMLEFVKTGESADLWKKKSDEIITIRHQINRFGLDQLSMNCEDILKRYINQDTALSMLIQAHLDKWRLLRHYCYSYINGLFYGLKFHETGINFLAFEFLEFKENSMTIFTQVNSLITHLIVSGALIESDEFEFVVNQCPQLIHLNISMSNKFSEKIMNVPNLLELDISSCNWLNDMNLSRILNKFSGLKLLSLIDNMQLDYKAFGMLSKLRDLTDLNISRNPQIHDEEFKIILNASPQIRGLDCSDCKNIGDAGFYELTRSLKHLIFLNLQNCQISDGILAEIAVKCNFLESINLKNCKKLADRAILEFVKHSKPLKTIIINRERLFPAIKQLKPYVNTVSD